MDQPISPIPQTQQLQKPVAQELPHLVVEEPKRGIAGTLGVVALSLLLLGIPIGIFLVSRPTQLAPQAAVTERLPEVMNGIFLESKLSSGDGIIPVDVYIKSPVDQINLVSAQFRFDPELVSIDKIATGSADTKAPSIFSKWIEVSFDNSKGSASVISGLPTPGLKTGSPNDEKIYLATMHLRSKRTGTTILQVTPESQILRNSDNQNIFRTGNDLALNMSKTVSDSFPAASPNSSDEESLIVLTSPASATNYSYFKPLEITWSSFNVETISQINLLVNGELLGPISQNLMATEARFKWQPDESLALPYVQLTNTFQIEILGISKDGVVSRVLSGPFGIVGTGEANGSPPSLESFSQNQLSVSDASRGLSNYLILPIKDKSVDLNKDEVVNELDLYLIRQNLLMRGVIK